jgi:hypothetical protein
MFREILHLHKNSSVTTVRSFPSGANEVDFQELADEAFADLLKKRKQAVGLKASLRESIGTPRKPR